MGDISKNFSLSEFTSSTTAAVNKIDNTPNAVQIANIQRLVKYVLQPARDLYGMPIKINSGFRSPKLNSLVGGAPTSAHLTGSAADLDSTDNMRLFEVIRSLGNFDQLINEFDYQWIHVSYKESGNRKEVLRSVKENGVTKYYPIKNDEKSKRDF